MRILQIHNYYATRGGECSVVDAEKQLLESRGHEVFQYTRRSENLPAKSVVAKSYDYWHIPHNPRVERDLARFVAEMHPTVAHVHNVFPLLSPAVYRVLARSDVPIVQTVHNFRFLCPNGIFFRKGAICERCQRKGYFQAIRYRCMRNSVITSLQYARAIRKLWHNGVLLNSIDRFIALNNFSAGKLVLGGIPQERIDVCGNFAARSVDDVAPKEDYVLYLGRLSPEKGIPTLLRAIDHAKVVRLMIAGSGPLEADIREYAATRENVELVGYVDGGRKEDLIRKARALIVPSEWYENFPISVVEAMSLGTPVIASSIGGLPEMIEDGRSGLLFEPGDVLGLAQHVEALGGSGERAAEMGCDALRWAKDQFGRERHGLELEKIYGRAAGSPLAVSESV